MPQSTDAAAARKARLQAVAEAFRDASGQPEDALMMLERIAQDMLEDAADLQATWGGDTYGARPWIILANGIERSIARTAKVLP